MEPGHFQMRKPLNKLKGRKAQAHLSDSARSQINAIQASLLGVLALLLGFTFS